MAMNATKSHAVGMIVLVIGTTTAAAEPFRQTLISTSQNVRVDTWEVVGKEATPGCPVSWTVRKRTLHGGRQEGTELVVIDNGKLQLTVIPTRGMGVLSVTMGEIRLGWDSPVKDVVHPKFMNLSGRSGFGWLEGFNEWLCRCGLENVGEPGMDKVQGESVELTLHGKIANLPAQEVELIVEREAPYRIRLRGRVDERMLFGPKLELQTEISTEPGATSFRVADVVTNRGARPQEFQIMYHTNFGRPLLEEGATLLAPVERVTPFDDEAARRIDSYATFAKPTLGFVGHVYCLRPLADPAGKTLLLFQNQAKDRGVTLSYAVKELPCLSLWKNTAAEADGYVVGVEPGTSFPDHRSVERQRGRLPTLMAGASQHLTIEFAIHAGKEPVQKVAKQITAIQDKRKPVIDAQPEKKD